jgi:hypothetical protein
MKINRVTLRALGTTGVLLAASLTMLALVSALVTFDAWPTRNGEASASQVAIQPAPAARVVRAVRHRAAATSAASRRSGAAASAAAARRAVSGGGGAVGNGGGGSGGNTPTHFVSAPSPYVPRSPPGEGDPSSGPVGSMKDTAPTPVHNVACSASTAVGGINGGAGAVAGGACGSVP